MSLNEISLVKRYSFNRLVNLIYRLENVDGDNLKQLDFKNEPIRFISNPCLGFPSSDIQSLVLRDEADQHHKYEMEVNFLGLHGVDSPLPGYYLEEISQLPPEDAVQRNFLDFFNHRSISMVYKIWRKYRYSVCYKENATDDYSSKVYSFLGFYEKESRDTKESHLDWTKLLGYSGFLSSNNRSPEVVSGVISHNFDLASSGVKVTVENFIFRRVKIPLPQQWSLGVANTVLAEESIIGECVSDRAGKFRINFFDIGFDRFKEFLPSRNDYKTLKKLIEVLLKDQFAYELNLHLKPGEAPKMILGKNPDVRLGWSSFLGSCNSDSLPPVNFQVRK